MTRFHLTLSQTKERNSRGGKRGRRPAKITAAAIDHVVNALQPPKASYSFAARMEKYALDAAEDRKLYAWLEERGLLPPPGELPAASSMTKYRRWKREQAKAEARS